MSGLFFNDDRCRWCLLTWSSFPQTTCRGAVIRCRCSCSEWRDFSPTISMNTTHKHTTVKSTEHTEQTYAGNLFSSSVGGVYPLKWSRKWLINYLNTHKHKYSPIKGGKAKKERLQYLSAQNLKELKPRKLHVTCHRLTSWASYLNHISGHDEFKLRFHDTRGISTTTVTSQTFSNIQQTLSFTKYKLYTKIHSEEAPMNINAFLYFLFSFPAAAHLHKNMSSHAGG